MIGQGAKQLPSIDLLAEFDFENLQLEAEWELSGLAVSRIGQGDLGGLAGLLPGCAYDDFRDEFTLGRGINAIER